MTILVLDEFLIALGLKVDKADIDAAEQLGDAVGDVADQADNAEGAMMRAYGATDNFVSAIEGALGVIGFFTGVLGGAWAALHGTIMELEDLIKDEKLLTDVTKDQLEQQKKYKESVETLGKRYQSLKVELAFGFLPTMQRMISALDGWLESNKDLIVNGILTMLNAITRVMDVIVNFIRFIDMIVEKTLGWEKTLYVIGAALLWVNRAMLLAFATNPVVWIIAAIAGLLILIDDFMTYIDGGESEFGDFWGAMLKGIDAVSPALQKIWDMLIYGTSLVIEFGAYVVQYLGGGFIDMVELVTAALTLLLGLFTGNTSLMIEAWRGMVENFVSMFRNFAMLFQPLANGIVSVFSAMMSAIGSLLSKAYDIITYPFRQAYDWIVNAFSKLPSLIGNIISKLPGVNTVANIGNAIGGQVSRTINNIGGKTTANINVTAPNPTSAANQTAAALQNTQAQRNFGGQAIA